MSFEPLFEDEGIALAVMGIVVVFAALTLVSVVIAFLPRIVDASTRWMPDEKAVANSKENKKDGLSEETLVVIAAAAMHVVGPSHRIVHIQPGTTADGGWAIEGRRQHHSSHRPR